MLLEDCLNEDVLIETKVVWARKGKNQVVKKYRCTYGTRKGRAVSSPSQCAAPIDLKKRLQLRKTKALRTKKYNIASKRIKAMNKRR